MTDTSASIRTSPYHNPCTRAQINDALKRLLDVAASGLGLLCLSPLFLYLAWLIKRDSPGPVFYRGLRHGRGGRTFRILKFRTMYEREDSYRGPKVTAQGDARITPLGKRLRDSKLNELPQLWNVLVGDMSLVGPRPEDAALAKSWPIEVRDEVLSVRPGVTSPASVLYRNEESLLGGEQLMDTYLKSILPSKLRLDQLYVRNRSFLLDLDVLFWTFLVLLPRLGDSAPPEERLFLGPLTRLTRRYLNWFLIDAAVTLCALAVSGLFWRTFDTLDIGWPKAVGLALGFSLLFSLAGVLTGVNRIAWSRSSAADALDLLFPVAIGASAVLLGVWLLGESRVLPVRVVLLGAMLALAGFVVVRYRSRLISGLASRWLSLRGGGAVWAQERVLIVGGGQAGQFAAWLLHSAGRTSPLHVAGFVDDDLYKLGSRIQGLNVLGRRAEIPALVEKHDVGLILFAIHNISARERGELLEICAATPARIVMLPDLLGALNGLVSSKGAPVNGSHAEHGNREVYAEDSRLPCELCLERRNDYQRAAWLAEIEEKAMEGDVSSVLALVREAQETAQVKELWPGLVKTSEPYKYKEN